MSTYLTEAFEGWTDADWIAADLRRKKESDALEIFRDIATWATDALIAGECTRDQWMLSMRRAGMASGLHDGYVADVIGRCFVRYAKDQGTSTPSRRGPKGAPSWQREMALKGIEWAKANGAVISRLPSKGQPSAFDVVATHLSKHGVMTTPAQVEKWYTQAGTTK